MPLTPPSDIVPGLMEPAARISPKYFYDQEGSRLFEAITQLPEYYPTRTETALMKTHAADIARALGPGRTVIELGAGNCQKARSLCGLIDAPCFVGVDISADFLQEALQALRADLPALDARAVGADLTHPVALPDDIPQQNRLVFYPGSSIGNFDPDQAVALLGRMRAMVDDAHGGLLIGFDLPKDVAVLEAAYDDAAGVTAAFNLNVLAHVNRLIGSDFDRDQWRHHAYFNAAESRIEMHLEATTDTEVRWPGGARRFAAGERIHTENSYKYPLPVFIGMLAEAGFCRTRVWTDERDWFAVVLAEP